MAILSAGINFGKPATEFIVESDESGVIQSCRNVVTGVEYVGGGGGGDTGIIKVTVHCTANAGEETTLYPGGSYYINGGFDPDLLSAIPVDTDTYGFAGNFDSYPVRNADPVDIEAWLISGKNFYILASEADAIFEVTGAAELLTYDFGGGDANAVIVSGDCTINYAGRGE